MRMMNEASMRKSRAAYRGSVIAYGLVIMAFVTVLLTAAVGFIVSHIRYSSQFVQREEAFQIAESGVDFYQWYLAHSTDGLTAAQVEAFWTTSHPYGVDEPYEAAYSDPGLGEIGKYRIEVIPPETGSTIVTIRSTGWTYKDPDIMRTLEVRFRRPSWSEDVMLSNATVRFGEGTETYGKIHANGGVRFDGIAHNLVSSSVASYDDPDHSDTYVEFGVHTHVNAPPATGTSSSYHLAETPPNSVPSRSDVFEAGRVFPVASVDFNGVLSDLGGMKSTAESGTNGSVYFSNGSNDVGRRIILKTDGTFDTCRVSSAGMGTKSSTLTYEISQYRNVSGSGTCTSCSGSCLENYTIPDGGVIFVEDNVWLSGQIDGKHVTVVAADMTSTAAPSVYISNDIKYTSYDGSDIIGIIGQNDVSTTKDSETDLRIDAALLAQQGRVGRPDFGVADHKDTITVYGAIASNERYGFSWTNNVVGSSWGYTDRNLYYDNNLLYYPPPYFPTGTSYEMDLWKEVSAE